MTDEDAAARITAAIRQLREALPAEAARVFAVLGVLPGGGVWPELLAAVAGIDREHAAFVVTAWRQGGLVDISHDGACRVLPQAAALACTDDPTVSGLPEASLLTERAVHAILRAARVAAQALMPARRALRWQPPDPAAPVPEGLTARATALAWLDRERLVVGAAAAIAQRRGLDRETLLVVDALQPLLLVHKYPGQASALDRMALDAAQRLGDVNAVFGVTTRIVRALSSLGELRAAAEINQRQEQCARDSGNRRALAGVIKSRAVIAAAGLHWSDAVTDVAAAACLYHELGQRRAQALALIDWGHALLQDTARQQWSQAVTHATRAHTLLSGVDKPDRYNIARADLLRAEGLIAGARTADPSTGETVLALLTQTLAVLREHGADEQLARAHDAFAACFLLCDDPQRARRHQGRAAALRMPTAVGDNPPPRGEHTRTTSPGWGEWFLRSGWSPQGHTGVHSIEHVLGPGRDVAAEPPPLSATKKCRKLP